MQIGVNCNCPPEALIPRRAIVAVEQPFPVHGSADLTIVLVGGVSAGGIAWHDGPVNKATWAMLNDAEKALLRQVEDPSLAELDEDDLLALHTRVRRARNKYASASARATTRRAEAKRRGS